MASVSDIVARWRKLSQAAVNDAEREKFGKRFLASLLEKQDCVLSHDLVDALVEQSFPATVAQVANRLAGLYEYEPEQFGVERMHFLQENSASVKRNSVGYASLTGASALIPESAIAPSSRLSGSSTLLEKSLSPASLGGGASALLERTSPVLPTRSAFDAKTQQAVGTGAGSLPSFPGLQVQRKVVDSGQATVYQGVYLARNMRVAIKIMHAMDSNAERAYRGELDALMQLKHANILPVITTYENCIVTKWMEGGPLNEWLVRKRAENRNAPLPWRPTGRRIACDIAMGLAYLHSEGFVHRDLKSLNVFMDADGTAVLADFGFAKSINNTGSVVVATGQLGTPHWMAPEMISNNIFSYASDVYALGIILWEICAGVLPYAGFTSRRALEDGVLKGGRPSVEPSWDEEAKTLMQTCWSHDPRARPAASAIVKTLGGQSNNAAANVKVLQEAELPMATSSQGIGYYEQFLEMRQDGAHTGAARLLKQAATAGYSLAQWTLGMYLLNGGLAMSQNVDEGIGWLRRAADNGHARSMFFLGKTLLSQPEKAAEGKLWIAKALVSHDKLVLAECRYYGFGMEKDYKESLQHYEQSNMEEPENPFILTFLGYSYKAGKGCSKNPKAALEAFQKASKLGHSEATYMLGMMHYNGLGTKKDRGLGRDLISKAASSGLEIAMIELKNLK